MVGAFICFAQQRNRQTSFPNSRGLIQSSIIAHKSDTYAPHQMSVDESCIKNEQDVEAEH